MAAEDAWSSGIDRLTLRGEMPPSNNGNSRGAREAVVEARGLQFAYPPTFELSVEELTLRAGSILGLLGPNGSGKTTLLRMIGLTIRPHVGEIRLNGQPVQYGRRGLQQRRDVATVFQNPILLDTTVRANVEAGLRFRGVRRRQRRLLVDEWLDRFGIARLADRRARLLSGGETRRVALARALVLEPKLLLLDEPFNDLDREIRHGLQMQLRRVLEGTNTAVVLVTHDLYEGLGLVERLGVMMDGRLVQHGSLREVLDRPVNAAVASLVGMTNLWPARVVESNASGCRVKLDDQIVIPSVQSAPVGNEVVAGVRPERIQVVRDLSDPPHGIVVAGIVEVIEPVTPLLRVRVRWPTHGADQAGKGVGVEVLDLPDRLGPLLPGECVGLAVAPKDVHLLPRE